MNTVYQHNDSSSRGYQGATLTNEECKHYLAGSVKDNLLDRTQRKSLFDILRVLQEETGFSSEGLMVDIQALENDDVNVPAWRIGEALAEVVLEENFQCRFHWNELRDARNPRGNKTGSDLVGFIEIDKQVLFLFGEIKVSSETNRRPPQVMTNADGIENQLRNLYSDRDKRLILISYLQNKAKLQPDGHPFKDDFNRAFRSYYSTNPDYQLIGVLVRDVAPDENDVSVSYRKLKERVLEPTGLQLLALYVPLPKDEWLGIINRHI